MLTYDELKIKDSEILTPEKWNGLVEKVEERDHEILSALAIKDGNIGIGTDMPERALHIRGTGFFDDDLIIESNGTEHSGALIFNKSQPDKAPAKAADLLGLVAFRGYDGNAYQNGMYITSYAHSDFNQAINGDLRIVTTENGQAKERLRITPNGNVGIGTPSPVYKLHVNGDLQVENWVRVKKDRGIYFQDYGGGFHMVDTTWIRTYGNRSFYQNTGILRTDGELQVGPSGNRLVVKADGNIGIGITNPKSKLHVHGLLETSTKLIDVKRFNNLGDNITYNTGYSYAQWSAAIAGFYIQDGDINEKGAGNMIYVRMINKSGKWHIQADMRSHGNNESWFVDVMFIRKTISRTIGM